MVGHEIREAQRLPGLILKRLQMLGHLDGKVAEIDADVFEGILARQPVQLDGAARGEMREIRLYLAVDR